MIQVKYDKNEDCLIDTEDNEPYSGIKITGVEEFTASQIVSHWFGTNEGTNKNLVKLLVGEITNAGSKIYADAYQIIDELEIKIDRREKRDIVIGKTTIVFYKTVRQNL